MFLNLVKLKLIAIILLSAAREALGTITAIYSAPVSDDTVNAAVCDVPNM